MAEILRTSSDRGQAAVLPAPSRDYGNNHGRLLTVAEVLRELAPNCKPTVASRLRREGILTVADLASLDKQDLRELGFTMLECARLLRWAHGGQPQPAAEPRTPWAASPLHPHCTQQQGPPPLFMLEEGCDMLGCIVSPEEEQARRHLDEVTQQADFWLSFVSPRCDPQQQASRQRRESQCLTRSTSMGEEVEDVREIMLERIFDLTAERVAQLFARMRGRSPDGLVGLDALRTGLHRYGLPELDDEALTKLVEAVSTSRHTGQEGIGKRRGVELCEFEVILSRMKLAQLLSGACPLPLDADTLGGRRMLVGSQHVGDFLMAVDYNTQSVTRKYIDRSRYKEFFFGHRKRPRCPADLPLVRWVHMCGLDLLALLALTVKYSLHPLGVEDVIEQCPTKIDRYGNHYFAAVEQLCLASQMDGSEPIRVHGRHVVVFCSGAPLFDTIITISEPDHDEKEDWPGGIFREAHWVSDDWVGRLQERLEASHSRLRERRADFLMYQVLDLCADELVKVTRAYTTRLSRLEEQPHITAAGLLSEWIAEVDLAQLQLTVVIRRLRGVQRLMRRLVEDPDLANSLSGYVGNVRDHIEEGLEDATYLVEKCRTILETSERALERHHAYCRQRADDRLNTMVFTLTGATAVFAPVQFLAGMYGMNFVDEDGRPSIPELTWEHGYLFFWMVTLAYLALSTMCVAFLHRRLQGKRKEDLEKVAGSMGRHGTLAAGVAAPLLGDDGDDGVLAATRSSWGLRAPLLGDHSQAH